MTDAKRGAQATSLLLVVLAALAIHGWISWGDDSISSFTDPVDYLFMADFYRHSLHGTATTVANAYYQQTRFPPVFPMLLATFGAGIDHVHRASIIANAVAVLAIVCAWWWTRIEFGMRTATLIALALLLYPAWFLLNLLPMSEPLGIVFLCSALSLLAAPHLTRNRLITAALVIGLAPLVRTALLPLVPAFAIWLLLRRPSRWPTPLVAFAISAIPQLAWMGYRALVGADSYASKLSWPMLVQGWGGWPDALWQQPAHLLMALRDNWDTAHLIATIAAGVLALFALVGCWLRLRSNKLDAWFLVAYMAMILVWPYPSQFGRFLVMVHPLMLVSAVTAATSLGAWASRTNAKMPLHTAPVVLACILALASTPALARYSHRVRLPIDPALAGEMREPAFFQAHTDAQAITMAELYFRVRLISEDIRTRVSKHDCVYTVFPLFLQLHGHMGSIDYPQGLDPDNSAEHILTTCNYFFVSGLNEIETRRPPLFPYRALEGWTQPLAVSRLDLPNGKTTIAAMLLERKH